MITDAYLFINKQGYQYINQSKWIEPKQPFLSHFGLNIELPTITLPMIVTLTASKNSECLVTQEYIVQEENAEMYEMSISHSVLSFKGWVQDDSKLDYPDTIDVQITTNGQLYEDKVKCEYANISGKITDFEHNPFPANVLFHRTAFGGDRYRMGVWSDEHGNYLITIPKGIYNAVYVDDSTYGVTSLENWCWHFIADKDEEHNYKVGNGEVYSLSPWSNNGGGDTLLAYFRPMILSKIKNDSYKLNINNIERDVTDISPELDIADLSITINNIPMNIISLQRIYETSTNYTLPAYVVQFSRWAEGVDLTKKQTLIVEYDTTKRYHELGYIAQSQGRTQFYYKDHTGLLIL